MWTRFFGCVAVASVLGCSAAEEVTEEEGADQALRRDCPRFDEAEAHYREALRICAAFDDALPTHRFTKNKWFADHCGGPTPLAAWDALVKATDACPSFGEKLTTDMSTGAKILRSHTERFVEYGFVSGLIPKLADGQRDWRNLAEVLRGRPRFTFENLSLQFDHVGGAVLRTPGPGVYEELEVLVLMMGGPTGTPVISAKNGNIALTFELRIVERGPGLLPYVSGLVVTSSEYGNEGAVFVPDDLSEHSAADWATACE